MQGLRKTIAKFLLMMMMMVVNIHWDQIGLLDL